MTPCPTDETLALFAVGDADDATRAQLLAHLEHCDDCRAAVLSASAHLNEEARAGRAIPIRSRWWIGAAAAAAAVIAVVTVSLPVGRDDSLDRMVAVASQSERAVEPRLSGGFAWARYRGPMRSSLPPPDVTHLPLAVPAGEAIERLQHDRSAEAQHAAGVAMVLMQRPEDAAAQLEAAARASRDAAAWSDLAGARYTAAMQLRKPALFPLALAAADRALGADPRLEEALFNRALILARMGSAAEARRAWQRYLEVDASSPWAQEARERMSSLP